MNSCTGVAVICAAGPTAKVSCRYERTAARKSLSPHQFREFDPRVELRGGRIVGQVWSHRAEPCGEVVGDDGADVGPEVVDQPFALLVGHRDEFAHQHHPCGRIVLSGQRPEHRTPGPQFVLLPLDQLQVFGEQGAQGGLTAEQPPDLVQAGAEVAEGADEFETGDGVQVVQPVPGGGRFRRRDDAFVGVVADGADRQSGPARHISNGVQAVVGHAAHYATSSSLRRNPDRPGTGSRLRVRSSTSSQTCSPNQGASTCTSTETTDSERSSTNTHMSLELRGRNF